MTMKTYVQIRERARELRKNPTPAEAFFWSRVRKKQLAGKKILRQYIVRCTVNLNVPIYYIVDFYHHPTRLIIEIDGSIHDDRTEEDAIRQQTLENAGFIFLRFSNDQVLNNWSAVKAQLLETLENSPTFENNYHPE